MLPARTPSSGEGSAERRTPPAYIPYPRYIPPRYRPPPPHYCFDAARFASDASKPRYLDVERERLVTRWLSEANDALISRRERPPRYRQKKNEVWNDNFAFKQSEEDSLTLREFVDKFSLPRVVKLDSDERPVLLYRVLEEHRRVEAVQVVGRKGKPVGKTLLIPDSYDGWFSTCGCRGGAQASAKGSISALVRARAYALVSPRVLSAYRARSLHDGTRASGSQYERAAARAGTPLRLAGVFADGSKAKAPKYAQLIDPQGNELYVPLNTKSELYEVCPDELSPNERTEDPVEPQSPDNLPSEVTSRAHRLPHLLSICQLPVRVKLLAGTLPVEMANDIGEDLVLRSAHTEPVLVMCTLPEFGATPSSPTKHQPDLRHLNTREILKLLPLNSNIKVRRTQLGYDSEKRMFLSSRLHKALTFCQLNVDNWIRQITYSELPTVDIKVIEPLENTRKFTIQGLKIDTTKLFGRSDKRDIPDENEGSIIFLGKNELQNMNYDVYSDDEEKFEAKSEEVDIKNDNETNPKFSNEKMNIFREDTSNIKRSKWFKHLKLTRTSDKMEDTPAVVNEKYTDIKDPFDPFGDKNSSIERYQDMSKLIIDKYGSSIRKANGVENCNSYKSLTSSSDMGLSSSSNSNPKKSVLTKSVSVQTGMPDDSGYDEEKSTSNIKVRKNLSVDQINYFGSFESDSSRKLKSLDENMLKKSASKSSTQLERRQRVQPDLIPEKKLTKAESYNQIQSYDDFNSFGMSSAFNDSDFVIDYKQHSYITEKLFSEFHVKTKKLLSKSTSNLIHPKRTLDLKKEGNNSNSMPTKTDRSVEVEKVHFKKKIDKPRAPTPQDDDSIIEFDEEQSRQKIRRSISSIQKRKLPVIEDMPYGQVADAVKDDDGKNDSDTNSDNIYAEICSPSDNITKKVEIKTISEKTNAFRHIEVVVIEKESNEQASEVSSILDEEVDIHSGLNTWDSGKKHAIRLEVTSSLDDYLDDSKSVTSERLFKTSSLNFTRSASMMEHSEAIYDTLK